MRTVRAAALATALFVLSANPASAAPGGPDPSFGRGGWVQASHAPRDGGFGIVRTTDGRVVVAGYGVDGSASKQTAAFFLTRYGTDGKVDPSFGTRGVVRTTFGAFSAVADLEQLPDGRLLAVGDTSGGSTGVAVARYTRDGALDATFGDGGRVVTTVGRGVVYTTSSALGVDGSLAVVGGASGGATLRPFVQKLTRDGAPDPVFGMGGTVVPAFGGDDAMATGVTMLPDGAVVVAGTIADGSKRMPFLVRYLPNGVLDPTFGSTGMTSLGGGMFGTVERTADGMLLVGGSRTERGDAGGTRHGLVARFLPTGAPDPTFGTAGVATVRGTAATQLYSVAVLPDGRIVACGDSVGRTRDVVLARLTVTGQPDTAFGRGGVAVHGLPGRHETANDLVVGLDGAVTTTGMVWSPANTKVRDTLTARFLA